MALGNSNYNALPQRESVVAMYQCADVSDESDNGYTLTNNGTTTFSAAKIGNGANFGTTNSTKSLSIVNNLGIDGGAITITAWVKLTTEIGADTYGLVSQNGVSTDTNYWFAYEYNGGTRRMGFYRRKVGSASDGPTYNLTMGTSAFYHLGLTYDTTNVRGYVAGTLVAGPTAASGNGTGASDGFYIGQDGYGAAASSITDEVIVWNVALSATEIAEVTAITTQSAYRLPSGGIGMGSPMMI